MPTRSGNHAGRPRPTTTRRAICRLSSRLSSTELQAFVRGLEATFGKEANGEKGRSKEDEKDEDKDEDEEGEEKEKSDRLA